MSKARELALDTPIAEILEREFPYGREEDRVVLAKTDYGIVIRIRDARTSHVLTSVFAPRAGTIGELLTKLREGVKQPNSQGWTLRDANVYRAAIAGLEAALDTAFPCPACGGRLTRAGDDAACTKCDARYRPAFIRIPKEAA